jgi:hypothetical protein
MGRLQIFLAFIIASFGMWEARDLFAQDTPQITQEQSAPSAASNEQGASPMEDLADRVTATNTDPAQGRALLERMSLAKGIQVVSFDEKARKVFDKETVQPDILLRSLLFTYPERVEIIDAKNQIGFVRSQGIEGLEDEMLEEGATPDPGDRYIHLQGIVYASPAVWTIWLNGKQVKPDALPDEVVNLRVFKEYIELKWYDDYTDRLIPVRLRPMQRFNIDTRMFLPG